MATKRNYDGPSPAEVLTADLIELMERGDLPPWRKEWTGGSGPHRNLATGASYSGANPILLELGSMMRGHTLPLWIGSSQARPNGWFPRRGSKSVRIIRPQVNKYTEECPATGDEITNQWVSFKPVPVFNAHDLVGKCEESQAALDDAIRVATKQYGGSGSECQRLDSAESVLEKWCVETQFGGSQACYSPTADMIRMPHARDFETREAFCATWAHEQAHSTGHSSRLDRPMGGTMGSKAYAREELVAELAAVLVCYRLQIGCKIENHAAYLKHWVEILKEDSKVIFKVLSQARAAADLIAPEAA